MQYLAISNMRDALYLYDSVSRTVSVLCSSVFTYTEESIDSGHFPEMEFPVEVPETWNFYPFPLEVKDNMLSLTSSSYLSDIAEIFNNLNVGENHV